MAISKIKRMGQNTIKIKGHEILRKVPVDKRNKIVKFFHWLFSFTPALKYRYQIKLKYYGHMKLRPKDVLTDQSGNIYTVIDEQNRVALLVSYTPMTDKPPIHGRLYLEGREVQQNSKKQDDGSKG